MALNYWKCGGHLKWLIKARYGQSGVGGGGEVGHVIFSHYLGVGQQILYPWTGVGHEFLDLHFSSCSGPPPLPGLFDQSLS